MQHSKTQKLKTLFSVKIGDFSHEQSKSKSNHTSTTRNLEVEINEDAKRITLSGELNSSIQRTSSLSDRE